MPNYKATQCSTDAAKTESSRTVSNKFHVINTYILHDLIARTVVQDGSIELYSGKDIDGKPVFWFEADGPIIGAKYPNKDLPEDRKEAYNNFIIPLQACIDPAEILIITELHKTTQEAFCEVTVATKTTRKKSQVRLGD